MIQQLSSQNITYPDSDGAAMADNTKQFRWIVTIKENLEILFANNADIFVAGDLLWYPVEGNNTIRKAPDIMVVFQRPKGDRGSYKQWEENNISPQVVFEIFANGNTWQEMLFKMRFYQEYGVEEYYIYDQNQIELTGFQRINNTLEIIEPINNWVSPILGIKFELTPETLVIYYPDERKFMTTLELEEIRQQEKLRADQATLELEQEKLRADQAIFELKNERQKYQKLLAFLTEKGINLDDLLT